MYTNVENNFGSIPTSIDLVSTEFLFGSDFISGVIKEGTFVLYFFSKHIIKCGKLNMICSSKENVFSQLIF